MAEKSNTHWIRGDLLTLAIGIVVDRVAIAALRAFVASLSDEERAYWTRQHENLWDLGQLKPVYDTGLALWMVGREYRESVATEGWMSRKSRVGRVLQEFRTDVDGTVADKVLDFLIVSKDRVKSLKFW